MTSIEKGDFRPRGALDRGDFDRGNFNSRHRTGEFMPGGFCPTPDRKTSTAADRTDLYDRSRGRLTASRTAGVFLRYFVKWDNVKQATVKRATVLYRP